MGDPLNLGIIGAGVISGAYVSTLRALDGFRINAVTDLYVDRALGLAERAGDAVAVANTFTELLERDDVDAVLNLTLPADHAAITREALRAGKHVYSEKPLAVSREDAADLVEEARKAGRRLACAPDTVLGTGTQTARKAVDDGLIGTPVAATAFMTSVGHEAWHPNPEFYYQPGGGPLLDMGPYYLSSLVHVLGPVTRVTGAASRPRRERSIANGPRSRTRFPVHVDTHVTGVLEHDGGALTTLVMSFDVRAARLPWIEIYGTTGTLSLPDPNRFDGSPALSRGGSWQLLPYSAGYEPGRRGVGLADLADALHTGRPHLATAELAEHVLDTMLTLLDAAEDGRTLPVTRTTDRPPAVEGIRTAGW
ncbi:Gfo/Idh/MocA family oxidoreductase [Streptomyces sp. B6B3]|uniref:Gfo/Idh/MocA family protein n=1 Tax=Streptomyces sp. B6B3 TaxID=3153570 RepID=UPI00325D2FEC